VTKINQTQVGKISHVVVTKIIQIQVRQMPQLGQTA
jgi:hypothetical protein